MRLLRVVVFVVLSFTVVLATGSSRAKAAPALSPTCNYFNNPMFDGLYFDSSVKLPIHLPLVFYAGEQLTISAELPPEGRSTQITASIGGIILTAPVPGTITYQFNTRALVEGNWYSNNIAGAVWQVSCGFAPPVAASNAPPPPVFFDPGDIRVDGQPGDRLAVYCPSDKQLQVIGIGANGKGAGVAVFNPADVIAAGKAGLSVPLKSYADPTVDLGRVTVQMTLNDGVTSIYIAWNGGILNATGQGDFKKMFVTPIRFCPFTFR